MYVKQLSSLELATERDQLMETIKENSTFIHKDIKCKIYTYKYIFVIV